MQNLTELRATYAEDLIPGARNAVRTCLSVAPGERVILVTDLETEEIAASLADQVRQVGASVDVHVMEDYGLRPMLSVPAPIRQALEKAEVSIYAGQPKSGELAFRRELTQIVDRRQIRHAHMVSISHRIMTAPKRRGASSRARAPAPSSRRPSIPRSSGSRPRASSRRPSGATCRAARC